jgi:hypothetical protein
LRRIALPFALTLLNLAATGAGAADLTRSQIATAVAVPPTLLPAVSGVNGSLDVAGGASGAGGVGQIAASLSLPVAQRFGVQIDGLAAAMNDSRLLGAGGHAFWRDPSQALIGLYGEGLAADVGSDTLRKGRIGAEAELYLNRMTLSGVAGYEWGNLHIRKGLFTETLAGYFVTDNLKLSAGYGYGFSGHMGTARVDWQLPADLGLAGATVYGEARYGEGGFAQALAGIKVPFGAGNGKSLQRREREDDPPVWLRSQPFAVASAKDQGQFTRKATDPCTAYQAAYDTARAAWHGGDNPEYHAAQNAWDAGVNAGCSMVGNRPGL